ncbi:hypothetical protein XIS1_900023 [Xenorhabdus innexi]|uniref:Uncharacterized protein n=1 Tax=Xenorhabdus innexi TaxID=290109 RepID=A0A1N6N1K8_9GAMM|nr:hypothetical protein XIS1_900023 [Xenorhabdus innexi]
MIMIDAFISTDAMYIFGLDLYRDKNLDFLGLFI